MTVAEQIDRLYVEKARMLERERVARDVAFLHCAKFPVVETFACGFEAMPLTLYHCNMLRLAGSPFLPQFGTPGPDDLALFLWIVSPQFIPGNSRKAMKARKKFFRRCRKFVKPASPKYRWSFRRIGYAKRAGKRLATFVRVVNAVRDYVTEAFQDKPPSVPRGQLDAPEYYSDFCAMAADMMRAYHGLGYLDVMHMPLKIAYQFVKEMKEHAAAEAGKPAVLWNGSDKCDDVALALLNADKRPLSHEDAEFMRKAAN